MKTTKNHLFTILMLLGIAVESAGQNTILGVGADPNNSGYRNTSVGFSAYNNNPSGKHNVSIGERSMENSSGGNSNVAVGTRALINNTHGSYNVALGASAIAGGTNAAGQFNIGVGSRTLTRHVSGNGNIALGHRTLEFKSTGFENIGIGYYSIANNTTGSYNIALGSWTGVQLKTGIRNLFLGYKTGQNVSTGSYNVIIGGNTGFLNSLSTTTKTGTDTNRTVVIADGASNQRMLIDSNGYTGIGIGNNNIPKNRLELGKGVSGTSGLRFRSYTSASPATFPNNGKVLTVNSNGDVVLTNDAGGSTGNNVNIYNADGTLEADRTVTMNNRRLMFNTAKHGRIYIGNNSNVLDIANFPTTTGNYRLYVEGGILTEKVKVALRSTTNWADYVFENDYELMSLNEVEDFIKKNKHLPGIESAENLAKNGLDLADMQAKQMAKIEELTLHLIEQNKAFEKQKQEIETLKKQVNILLNKSN